MAKSFCRLLILVNHAFVAIFNVANMSFTAIRFSRKILNLQYQTIFNEANTLKQAKQCDYIKQKTVVKQTYFDIYSFTNTTLDNHIYYTSREFPIQNFHRRTTDIL